jgi:hypothetical protein
MTGWYSLARCASRVTGEYEIRRQTTPWKLLARLSSMVVRCCPLEDNGIQDKRHEWAARRFPRLA